MNNFYGNFFSVLSDPSKTLKSIYGFFIDTITEENQKLLSDVACSLTPRVCEGGAG